MLTRLSDRRGWHRRRHVELIFLSLQHCSGLPLLPASSLPTARLSAALGTAATYLEFQCCPFAAPPQSHGVGGGGWHSTHPLVGSALWVPRQPGCLLPFLLGWQEAGQSALRMLRGRERPQSCSWWLVGWTRPAVGSGSVPLAWGGWGTGAWAQQAHRRPFAAAASRPGVLEETHNIPEPGGDP